MIGISLKESDLHLDESGELAVVERAEAVAQHIRQRAKTFKGEWFLDDSIGVDWINRVFGNQYNPAIAESILKAAISSTEGVTSITSFSVRFLDDLRNLDMRNISIETIYDKQVSL